MVTMKAADVHNDISTLWDKVTEQPVMIQSAGKPVAVVLSVEEYNRLAAPRRQPKRAGCGRHLLSGAGISVNDLLATPIDDVFSDYNVSKTLQE